MNPGNFYDKSVDKIARENQPSLPAKKNRLEKSGRFF
jgi:hypothetical protein